MRLAYFGGLCLIKDSEKGGRSVKGGKKSKLWITVALFVSASGMKEKPIVITKSENPRCLNMFPLLWNTLGLQLMLLYH